MSTIVFSDTERDQDHSERFVAWMPNYHPETIGVGTTPINAANHLASQLDLKMEDHELISVEDVIQSAA
ncbi:MAG: hypothetical protein MRY49_02675 [Candidatus Pacebacteria bacterium]|nr:hypothetical protein [Candidatus Paceibacterota bacterium]